MPDTPETSAAPQKAATRKPRTPRKSSAAAAAPDAAEKPKKAAPARTRAPRAKKETAPEPAAPAAAPAAPAASSPTPKAEPKPKADPKPKAEHKPKPAPAEPAEPASSYPAPETVGGHEPQGEGKHRKRRRRNRRGGEASQQPVPGRHAPVDPDELNRRAWKIFLGEVTEEGLALMDDRTAAEAARRSFRVAELFLIEASHHRPAPAAEPEPTEQQTQ